MTRGRAAAIAIAGTVAALAALAVASVEQARARAAAVDVAPVPGPPPIAPVAEAPGHQLCVAGPGAAAAAAAPARPPILDGARLDPGALAAVSALAFALERTIERHGGAIPQRTGIDPATGAPVTPAAICQPVPVPAAASSPPR